MLSREALPHYLSRRRPAVRLVLALFTAGLTVGLASCGPAGFQPLYGVNASGVRASDKLRSVSFAPIPGRVGQRIRNELVFDQSAAGDVEKPTSRLDVTISESVLSTLVNAQGNSGSQVYQIEARYKLIDITSKKTQVEGRALGRAAFDRFEAVYSNIRAREDAENRVAKTIADDIRTRLAGYLATTAN